MKKILLFLVVMLCAVSSKAALSQQAQGGWYESCWMEFTGLSSSYTGYNAYVSADGSNWTQLDGQLIRSYGTYGRVEALGLPAGTFKLKVVPVVNGTEVAADAVVSGNLEVRNFDRSGFAHHGYSGVGAYNDNGTLKTGAKVFYVTSKTAKTISTSVVTDDKGGTTKCTGLQAIITAYEKGRDTTPIAFRFLGVVNASDLDALGSKAEGLQVKGRNADSELNMTFEGVGNDAVIYGFGFLVRNAASVEIRNLGVKTGIDDGISLDTDNDHIWIHNVDVFYGPNKGGDKKKGDGAIDVKSNSKHVTISYVHFWDTGKSTMCGMKSESGPNWITYHHNWFDHSDSRHARIRTMSVHMYNNYFDGIAKYGAGACMGSSVFMDRNYFRACPRPMMISLQGADTKYGTDLKDAPTFSGESGGMIKSYGNTMVGTVQYRPYSSENSVEFDCYEVTTASATVPATVTSKSGGNKYNNFDTNGSMYTSYAVDNADDVPTIVTNRTWGAGRCQGGDFTFEFTSADDTSYDINTALESKLADYKTASNFKGFLGEGQAEAPDASASFTLDGKAISFSNLTYTKSLASTDTQAEFTVVVTPAEATSQITVEGATSAGTNTYKIAAPTAGATATATFTITNGTAQMVYTIIIDKTQAEPVTPDPDAPELDGLTIVYFEQNYAVCDNADVSTLFDKGNMNSSTDKGIVKYLGAEYGECVKMESSTSGTIMSPFDCKITVVFGSKKTEPKFTLAGTTVSLTNSGNGAWTYTFNGEAGKDYEIAKGSKGTTDTFLYAVVFEPSEAPVITGIANISKDVRFTDGAIYDLMGRRIAEPQAGKVYIMNGKKFIKK